MPMFDGVTGTTAVTLTAKRTAAAAPIPARSSRPRAASSAQQAPSWIAQAPSCAAEARMPCRGSRKTVRPARTWISAPCSAAPSLASRPLPLRRVSRGATRTTSSSTIGTKLKAKIFWVLEWKRGVVEMMITPSSSRATMLSIVCETRVPIRTGNVSRTRPVRRESESARAGSPSRAGRVADISTPIIVAEVTSRRRTGRLGSAARTIQYQDAARKKSERAIRPEAISTQVTSERTMLSTTLSTPILRAASAVRPMPSTAAMPRAARRATRRLRLPLRASGGSSDGRR